MCGQRRAGCGHNAEARWNKMEQCRTRPKKRLREQWRNRVREDPRSDGWRIISNEQSDV